MKKSNIYKITNTIDKNFYERCNLLADKIHQNKTELINILCDYETYEAAIDEIDRGTRTLIGLKQEHSTLPDKILTGLTMSTFFPLNLPLYSLILFGIAPSCFTSNVFIRPPAIMNSVLEKIFKNLDIHSLFPEVSLHPTQRHIFIDLYAKVSDIILFTGKYKNALTIASKCPDALMLYNGSGVNPFILLDNGDPSLFVEKLVEMRCFNSGQDCAGPDAILIPTEVSNLIIKKTKDILQSVKVGDSIDHTVKISKTMKTSYVEDVVSWLQLNNEYVVHRGDIDKEKSLVSPSIIIKPVSRAQEPVFHEFFAPIFYFLTYDSKDELINLINKDKFTERAMYTSLFGTDDDIESTLSNYVKVLKNKNVNDVEIGNTEYGGYGQKANFVMYNDTITPQPILISRDLHEHLLNNQ